MKIIILGQPRSGKSTLAHKLSNTLNIPIICTDLYRRKWGFHEPWKGYETEIDPNKQQDFYKKLIELYNSFENVILEGSAINPKDVKKFKYDKVVLLYRNINHKKMFELSRKYDKDWTCKRNDEYLLELFSNYCEYAKKWAFENQDILVDTTNFEEGIENAYNKILNLK